MVKMTLSEQIKQKAIELGFDLVGITDASPVSDEDVNHLRDWLNSGRAGQMTWMHNNIEKRTNPAKLLPSAKSVIVVGLNYKPPSSLRAKRSVAKQSRYHGRVAAYAQYEDYHPFIKKLLRNLVDFIISKTGTRLKYKICVDSAPLLERALAVRAGLGFIGKNRMLVNPRLGPQILLGEVLTNLELDTDKPIAESCPDCGRCVTACPTGALKPDGLFDAGKCVSYLTIEADGEIPAELAPKVGNHLFGCCDCVLACPYQQKALPCANKEFVFHSDRAEIDLNEILTLTDDQFQIKFANSPILRAGHGHLKRIAKICLANLA